MCLEPTPTFISLLFEHVVLPFLILLNLNVDNITSYEENYFSLSSALPKAKQSPKLSQKRKTPEPQQQNEPPLRK